MSSIILGFQTLNSFHPSQHVSMYSDDNELLNSSVFDYSSENYTPMNYLSNIASSFISTRTLPKDSGFLPPGVKCITDSYVVYERPPCVKNIFYSPYKASDADETNAYVYSLPIPWQLYIVQYSPDYLCSEVYMFFMDGPLNSLDQNIYMPALPNFYTNALLCRPMFSTMDEVTRYTQDISGVIASSYDWVWNNGTNNDLTEPLVHLILQNPEGKISSIVKQQKPLLFTDSRVSSTTYFNPDQVSLILLAWESLTLDDIMNYKWPNPSKFGHFGNSNMLSRYMEMDAYNDNLYQYLRHLIFDEESTYPTDSYIEDIIDNDDYSHAEYIEWLISSGIVDRISPEWIEKSTYIEFILNMKKSQLFKSSSFKLDYHNCSLNFFPQTI